MIGTITRVRQGNRNNKRKGNNQMTIAEAQAAASKFLSEVKAAVDIEIEVITSAGHKMFVVFDRSGVVAANLSPRIC